MTNAVIVSTARTPLAKSWRGAFNMTHGATLGGHAVHAAMAGKTGMVVARWHDRFVHLPMSLVNRGRRKVDPHGDLWRSVLESTGRPPRIGT